MTDAPKPPPATRLQIALLLMLAFSALLNYIDRQALAVMAPTLKIDLHLTDRDWGWVLFSFAAVYIVASSLGGRWIDRIGVFRGLAISTAVWSLTAAGHALATGFGSLCMWRGLLAVGEGPGGASLLKGVRRVMPPHLRDTGCGVVGAGTMLGALIAPITVIPLASAIGWRAAFLVTAGLSFVWLPVWIALASRPKANLGPDISAPDTPAGVGSRLDYRSPGLWATLLTIFFTIPPTVFTLGFLAIYLNKAFHTTQNQAAWLLWQPYLAMDLGQLSGGFVVFFLLRRGWGFLSARRLVLGAGFGGSLLMLGMLRSTDLTETMCWLNAARFFFQFGYVALLAYGIESVQERQAGLMNGVMNSTFGACNLVFSPLIGEVATRWGYNAVILMVSLMPLIGLTCWLVLSQVHANRSALPRP